MAITPATFTPANVTMLNALEGAIPFDVSGTIIQEVMEGSLTMQLARYEEMNALEKEFDLFLGGMSAYWVGEGQRIETTKPTWAKARLVAKKLGVILPVTREYLHYKMPDFFNVMRPSLAQALYRKFDAATILGIDNPFDWSVDKSATDADNVVEGDISTENFDTLISGLNDNGVEPNAIISKVANRTLLRGLVRDENGMKNLIYDRAGETLDGVPVFNVDRQLSDFTKGTLYAGDFNQAVYGIPYSMTYRISEDATLTTITGEDGEPVNLFEREMAALRVTMDVAFMITEDEAFGAIKPTVVPGG